ncbi:MAG: hypothetical protein ACRYF4_10190 [Janthinobacterium lividum]
MVAALQFLWNATRGSHLRPWRSPYLRWRVETYSGMHAENVGAGVMFRFLWKERGQFVRFLRWTGEMRDESRNR